MAKVYIVLFVAVLTGTTRAQWKKIADFGEPITCVYYSESAYKEGFVGTQSSVYKTTDGGGSWTKVWGGGSTELYYVTDICFKDSLTGWFTVTGRNDACYRTQDGGATWQLVAKHPYGAGAVYYCSSTQLLFLSTEGDIEGGFLRSANLGDDWDTVSTSFPSGISFGSPVDGIVAADFITDTGLVSGFYRTADGGKSWIFAPGPDAQPLAIQGTGIRLATTIARIRIWRSDDSGATWHLVHDFGPVQDSNFKEIAPYGTACIRGDLSRLYLQTDDSGMYVSFDSGRTWRPEGGPSYLMNFSRSRFYAAHGVTIAGWLSGETGIEENKGLWMEEWPRSTVKQSDTGACFELRISGSEHLESASAQVPVLVRCFGEPASISLQVFDALGRPVLGPRKVFLSPGNWSRVELDLARSSGVYWVRASDGLRIRIVRFVVE